jgi:hypothetical protein
MIFFRVECHFHFVTSTERILHIYAKHSIGADVGKQIFTWLLQCGKHLENGRNVTPATGILVKSVITVSQKSGLSSSDHYHHYFSCLIIHSNNTIQSNYKSCVFYTI